MHLSSTIPVMLAGLLMLSVGQSLVTNDYRSQLLAASSDHIRSSMSDHWSEVANKHMPQSTREDFHALAMDTLTEPLIKRLESVVGDYSQGFLQKRAVGIVSETNPLHMDVVGQAVPNLLDAIKDVVRSWGRVYAGIVRALKAGIPVKEWRHINFQKRATVPGVEAFRGVFKDLGPTLAGFFSKLKSTFSSFKTSVGTFFARTHIADIMSGFAGFIISVVAISYIAVIIMAGNKFYHHMSDKLHHKKTDKKTAAPSDVLPAPDADDDIL